MKFKLIINSKGETNSLLKQQLIKIDLNEFVWLTSFHVLWTHMMWAKWWRRTGGCTAGVWVCLCVRVYRSCEDSCTCFSSQKEDICVAAEQRCSRIRHWWKSDLLKRLHVNTNRAAPGGFPDGHSFELKNRTCCGSQSVLRLLYLYIYNIYNKFNSAILHAAVKHGTSG